MSITRKKEYRVLIYEIALGLVILSLPYILVVNSISIMALALAWIFANNFREKIQNIRRNFLYFIPFGLYYCSLVYGYFISVDKADALFDFQSKLPLLIIPLFVFSGPRLVQESIRRLQLVHLLTMGIGCLLLLGVAFYQFGTDGNTTQFFYHNLAHGLKLNAIYLSLNLTVAIINGLRLLEKQKNKWPIASLLLFLFASLILLSSKSLVFYLCISVGIYFLIRQKAIALNWKFSAGFVLLLVVGLLLSRGIIGRYTTLLESDFNVVRLDRYNYSTPFNGLTLRLTQWKFASEIATREGTILKGVGNGDAQNVMDDYYVEKNIYTGNPEIGDSGYLGYNLHNQFFEDWFAMGFIGLITLCILFVSTVIHSRFELTTLLVVLAFVFMAFTESFLERQYGIVLFSTISSLGICSVLNGKVQHSNKQHT